MINDNEIINDSSSSVKSDFSDLSEYYISDSGVGTSATYHVGNYSLTSVGENLFTTKDEYSAKKNDFFIEMTSIIENLDFEFGRKSELEEVFNKYHTKYGFLAIEWLSKLFIKNIHSSNFVLGIVLLLARLNPNDIGGCGETMILNALYVHPNLEIKEAAIRVIEKWNAIEFVDTLKSLNLNSDWLDEYKQCVINDLTT